MKTLGELLSTHELDRMVLELQHGHGLTVFRDWVVPTRLRVDNVVEEKRKRTKRGRRGKKIVSVSSLAK